ncbi:MAG: hypothetical protein ACU0BF_08900 [Paracoccaceae bacterium]
MPSCEGPRRGVSAAPMGPIVDIADRDRLPNRFHGAHLSMLATG